MSEMLKRLGLDVEILACRRLATDLRFAVCRCQSCDADQACQDWLAHAPELLDRAPSFCRNAEFFAYTRDRIYGAIRGSDSNASFNICGVSGNKNQKRPMQAQTAIAAEPRSASAVDPLIRRIWPPAMVAFGLGLAAAWVCLLIYGLVTVIKLAL